MFKFLFILINIFIFSGCSLKPEIEYNDSVIPTELKNSLDKNSNLEYIQPNWENFVKNDDIILTEYVVIYRIYFCSYQVRGKIHFNPNIILYI